ncbi:MAG: LolA family protein [Magnetovibrionaceae bacterium]
MVLSLGLGLTSPAAAEVAPGAQLDAGAKADLQRVEQYFSDLSRLQARFLQIASTGEVAEGRVAIHRPGRMRIVYDPPVPVEIIADGLWFIFHDTELDQTSHLPLNQTPAGVFLDEVVTFDDPDITVTGFQRGPGSFRVSLVKADDPAAGELTLVFSDRPLALRQWSVLDAQGIETTISLQNVRFTPPFDQDLFQFKNPATGPRLND